MNRLLSILILLFASLSTFAEDNDLKEYEEVQKNDSTLSNTIPDSTLENISPIDTVVADTSLLDTIPLDTIIVDTLVLDSIDFVLNLPRIDIWTITGNDPPFWGLETPEDCFGATIGGNEYVGGRMRIIEEDSVIYESGEFISKDSITGIRVKIRGNATGFRENPPFKIKLNKKNDPFNFGFKNKEWVLLNASTMMVKLPLGYLVSDLVEREWHPQYKLENLFFNNKYRGLYYFVDPVEKEKHRINIEKSGFIIENDNYWWKEDIYFKTPYSDQSMGYTFKYPEAEDLDSTRFESIKNYMQNVDSVAYFNGNVEAYLNLQSFSDYLLCFEIMGLLDHRGSNMYMYKNDSLDSKLTMGPLWDLDSAFWCYEACPHRTNKCFMLYDLCSNAIFQKLYREKWNYVKDFLFDEVEMYLDSIEVAGEFIDKARVYSTNGECSLVEDIDEAREWFRTRTEWIEENLTFGDSIITSLPLIQSDYNPLFVRSVTYCNTLGAVVYISHSSDKLPSLPRGIYIRIVEFNNGTRAYDKIVVKE